MFLQCNEAVDKYMPLFAQTLARQMDGLCSKTGVSLAVVVGKRKKLLPALLADHRM